MGAGKAFVATVLFLFVIGTNFTIFTTWCEEVI
jgi:hypothetical protein